ncbi:MAG: hypothetical protein EBU31_06960, partial [Proteobacteria bacterium]|nr:hypothetical protein [Pseudomonadota bacterium]
MDHDLHSTPVPADGFDAAAFASIAGDASLRDRCKLFGIAWADALPESSPEAAARLAPDAAVRLRVVPLREERGRLVVAMLDPLDIAAVDETASLARMPVMRIGLDQALFSELMRDMYGTTAARMAESLAEDSEVGGGDVEHNLDAIEA